MTVQVISELLYVQNYITIPASCQELIFNFSENYSLWNKLCYHSYSVFTLFRPYQNRNYSFLNSFFVQIYKER